LVAVAVAVAVGEPVAVVNGAEAHGASKS
jgi:hypothetical protein